MKRPTLTTLMAQQLGLVSRGQGLEHGLTEHQVDRLIHDGAWVRVQPGVFRAAAAPVTFEQRILAALLAAGDGAAASHRTAAVLHGTRQFSSDLVEISVPAHRRPRLVAAKVHQVARLDEDDVRRHGPLAVTRPARTFLDASADLPLRTAERLLEEWLADRVLTVTQLRATLDEHGGRGRRGSGIARRLLDARVLGDVRGDSTDEAVLLAVLREYGAPLPTYHHLIRAADGRVLLEPDYAYVPERLALLVHGFHVKTRHRRSFEGTLAEANLLADLDWEVRQYTPSQIRARPLQVCREIEEHRRRRAVHTGAATAA